jgi:hypothetical protein
LHSEENSQKFRAREIRSVGDPVTIERTAPSVAARNSPPEIATGRAQ